MTKIKILSFLVVALVPMVVISFSYDGETNFNLGESNFGSVLSSLEYDAEECIDIENSYLSNEFIRVLRSGKVEEIPLEEYVVGVVAAEMPASFNIEALKAQAVASRTYALYRRKTSSGNYDVTDDTRTQVYIDKSTMKKRWGSEFDKYYNKVLEAVESTRGEVITYDNKIIEAFYFASSGGSTQDAVYVFNESRDYLVGVQSEYEAENTYVQEYSIDKIKSVFGVTCSKLSVDYINYNDEGYVEEISVCSSKMSGINLSYKLGLRSSCFSFEIGDKVKIITKGFGHGVGMSQYGAQGYAQNGFTYEEILKHYYTGVSITSLKNV